MKLLFSTFCFLLTLTVFGQNSQVSGTINGLGNDTLFIEYMTFSQRLNFSRQIQRDTITSTNDYFIYTIAAKEPVILKVDFNKFLKQNKGKSLQSNMLFLMPNSEEHLSLKGDIDTRNFLSYIVSGSDFNRDLAELRMKTKEQILESENLQLQLNRDYEVSDEERKALQNELLGKINMTFNQIKQTEVEYIESNPNSELAAFLLCQQPLDVFGKFLDKLGSNAKEGRFQELLKQKTEQYNREIQVLSNAGIIIGEKAPDFTLKSAEGKDVSLHSIEKEYVLLYFWGTWCSWCITSFPETKKFYSEYSDKLEILGIACNDTDETWKKSIIKHELSWLNVINSKKDNVSEQYAINTYPTKILLDRDKKIIGIFKGESRDIYKKIGELMR